MCKDAVLGNGVRRGEIFISGQCSNGRSVFDATNTVLSFTRSEHNSDSELFVLKLNSETGDYTKIN